MIEELYKRIFSENLKYYMDMNNKTQSDLINDLGFNKSAVSTWCSGTRLPRMDKIELLANYFKINRSDLIEQRIDKVNENDEEQRRIFAKNLNRFLALNSKTQKEVADSIGVSPQTFNTWCQGIALPRMGKVQLLADYFGISKADLIDETNEKEEHYYLNDETREIAQEVFENPDLRSLFYVVRDIEPEKQKALTVLIKWLKEKE